MLSGGSGGGGNGSKRVKSSRQSEKEEQHHSLLVDAGTEAKLLFYVLVATFNANWTCFSYISLAVLVV